jgi:5-oxoprolinase (ATP-hydrolysing)
VKTKFLKLTEIINSEKHGDDRLTPEAVAMGFLQVANAAMTRPIRTLSEGRGFETSSHNLACFGGAGGQHATAVARDLGIKRILIHRMSSILSAYGMALADVVVEVQEPESVAFNKDSVPRLRQRIEGLRAKAAEGLISQGFTAKQIVHENFLNMRYRGSDTALMIPQPKSIEGFADAFTARHLREFGFTQPREILVDDIRIRSVGRGMDIQAASPFEEFNGLNPVYIGEKEGASKRMVFFEKEGWVNTCIHRLGDLPKGCKIRGPAMIIDATQTIVLDPASEATILSEHVIIELLDTEKKKIGIESVDPIHLSVFGHRFMSVAEQVCISLVLIYQSLTSVNRWVKRCKKHQYQPISRRDLIIHAQSSPLTVVSLPMRHIFQHILDPCHMQLHTRLENMPKAS